MTSGLVLAHHPADWLWLVVPVVLVLSWVRWAARRARGRGEEGMAASSGSPNIADESGRVGRTDAT